MTGEADYLVKTGGCRTSRRSPASSTTRVPSARQHRACAHVHQWLDRVKQTARLPLKYLSESAREEKTKRR